MDIVVKPYDDLVSENRKLLAENARLQSEIDAANAQKPVGTSCDEVADYGLHQVNFTKRVELGQKLYARPIPAQQSPAVAVPDEIPRDDYADSESKAHRRGWNDCREEMLRNIATLSPRITEQDAFNVIDDFWLYCIEKKDGEVSPTFFDDWFNDQGRALLTKLNEANHAR